MKEFKIGPNEAGQRFDKYLGKLFSEASMSFVFKMLRKKNFTLNDKKAAGNELLKEGDVVKLFLSDDTFDKFASSSQKNNRVEAIRTYTEADLKKMGLHILYEDKHILAFYKPAGMLSQKSKETDVSVNEYLIGYLLQKKELTKEEMQTFRPSIANRLDRNTSGLILCGKTLAGLQYLAQVIKDRSLQKYYVCLVEGKVTESVDLEGYLHKDSKTNTVKITKQEPIDQKEFSYIKTGINPLGQYKVSDRNKEKVYSELSIHLYTGKTHQIRAHLASIGHPIVGDFKYGNKDNSLLAKRCNIKRQLLHAYRVVFPRTEGGFEYLSNKEIIAEPYGDYERALKELKNGNME